MDAVASLEHRISALRAEQQRTPRLSAEWWTLQEEIDRLDADAKTITARQREEIIDRNAERIRAELDAKRPKQRRFTSYPIARRT